MVLLENLAKGSTYFFWVPFFRPETVEKTEPLFGVGFNIGFIPLYAASSNICNVLFIDVIIGREGDSVKINVKFIVL